MKLKFFIFSIIFSIPIFVFGQDMGYFTDLSSTKNIEDSVIILDIVDEKITNELYKFKNLEKLFIVSSQIDSISEKICGLKNLQVIKIENSKLKFIHSKVFDLPNLKTLLLSGNKLNKIDCSQNETVEYLDLSFNPLVSIDNIANLSRLSRFVCRGNKLEELPCNLFKIKTLKNIEIN